ncbi:four helix bundle protein [Candidatus Peregrinibacteria bacterium]|nr:four helix bundle protein [Candidatus Peregrinibacteria bacterium]
MTYKATKLFPNEERFGLVSQLCRAVISVENNIAEGSGRRTKKDFIHFLYNSLGSLFEVYSMIRVCNDLNYISNEQVNDFNKTILSVKMMLKKFISALSSKV